MREPRRKYFTEDNVLDLPARRKQYVVWDAASGRGTADAARGLCILVSPKGAKSYRVCFYYPGSSKPHYMKLGRVGEITLAQARQKARVARGVAGEGHDPSASSVTKSDHFKAAVERYISGHQKGRKLNVSADETQNVILRATTEWHSRPIATIRYNEVETLLERIRDGDDDHKPRPYLANRVFSHLKDFFKWAVKSRLITVSPMSDMDRPWEGERPRNLPWFKGEAADKIIKDLWVTADKIGGDGGRYLKAMMLLGKRKSHLMLMRWEQIDDTWFWNAPETKSKNKPLTSVPLAKWAQRILSPRQKEGPVFPTVHPNRLLYRIRKVSERQDFIYHGLRHVIETKLASMRVPKHVRDFLLDHSKPETVSAERGTGSVYDHHAYVDEMAQAAETWAAYVERLVSSEGVRKLR